MLRLSWLLPLLLLAGTSFGADVEKARAHFKAGLAAFTLGDYAKAAVEYEAAYSEEPDPALLYNAAQAHRLAGNKPRALFLYRNYLRYFPGQGNEREVQRHIANLQVAIESEQHATTTPPMDSKVPALERDKPKPAPSETPMEASPPPPPPTPEAKPAAKPEAKPAVQAALVQSPAVRPQAHRSRAWVWGVVGGVAVVVAVGLGVGLGVGLSGTSFPSADIGSGRLH